MEILRGIKMKEIILPAVERYHTGKPDLIAFKVTNPTQQIAIANLVRYQEIERKVKSDYYHVRIKPPFRPRSTGKNSQCNRFNGGIQVICKETGLDFDDVKMYIKRRALKRDYPFLKDENGNIVYSLLDGEALPLPERLASVEDAIMLNEELNQVAAEMGVYLWDEELV